MGAVFAAVAHYLAALVIVSTLVAQCMIFQLPLNIRKARTLRRLDTCYGIAGVTMVFAGSWRAVHVGPGLDLHLANGWFVTKLVLFAVLALLSFPAAVKYGQWSSPLRRGEVPELSARGAAWIRASLFSSVAVVVAIVIASALMAGGYWQFN